MNFHLFALFFGSKKEVHLRKRFMQAHDFSRVESQYIICNGYVSFTTFLYIK